MAGSGQPPWHSPNTASTHTPPTGSRHKGIREMAGTAPWHRTPTWYETSHRMHTGLVAPPGKSTPLAPTWCRDCTVHSSPAERPAQPQPTALEALQRLRNRKERKGPYHRTVMVGNKCGTNNAPKNINNQANA